MSEPFDDDHAPPIPARPACRVAQARVELADPHVLSDIRDRRSIVDALYDALVRRGPDGRFRPWLALDWQRDESCRRWRFTLRPGVACHDGGVLTAADAAASIRRALAPDLPGELGTQGVLRGYLEGTLLDVPDAQTLVLTAPTSIADLLDVLVDIPIVPERALAGLPAQPVGSGPYRLETAAPGRVILAPFDRHWAGPPPLACLDWRAEPDASNRAELFQHGEVDWAVDPPRAGPVAAERLSQPSTLCVIFMFNLFAGPATDVRVRRALHHALDVDALIADTRIAAGAARRLAGPLTPAHDGADPSVTPYRFDPDRARRLLGEAGFGAGLDLVVDLPARFPDEAVPLSEAIAEQWAEVGVRCRLRVHEDRPGYAERVRTKQVGDLCCFDSSPASPYRIFREKLDSRRAGPWWLGYHNPAVNADLDRAAETAGDEERHGLFRSVFRHVHDDAPWLFLYAPDNLWLRSPKWAAVLPSPEGRLRFI